MVSACFPQARQRKFENGLISALDLQTAANTLLQAKSDKLRARLQYIVKSRMVDYYNGKPLVEIQNAEFKIQN